MPPSIHDSGWADPVWSGISIESMKLRRVSVPKVHTYAFSVRCRIMLTHRALPDLVQPDPAAR